MNEFAERRLVIFGCGYVGAAVAEHALSLGMSVTALTRNEIAANALRARGVKTICALLADDDWHRSIQRGADFVLNTVSAFDPTAAGYRSSYVDGARSIIAWAENAPNPIGTLVYTSSTGVYPQGGGAMVDEDADVNVNSPSAEILLEAEQIFLRARVATIRRAMVLRLAGIYGPGRHSLLDQLRAGAKTINGRGEHRLNLVHRDDVVRAIFAAFAAPAEVRSGVFNISDGQPGTKSEFVSWLSERLERNAPAFDATVPSIRRGGAGVPDRIIDSQRARSVLGWTPRFSDFRAGYHDILARAATPKR